MKMRSNVPHCFGVLISMNYVVLPFSFNLLPVTVYHGNNPYMFRDMLCFFLLIPA